MAIGFPPKYHEKLHLQEYIKHQFLLFAILSAEKLGWDISFVSETEITAHTNFSFKSNSEEVNIKLENDIVYLKSSCDDIQLFDWWKNQTNIESILYEIEKLKSVQYTPEEIAEKTTFYQAKYSLKSNHDLDKSVLNKKEKITSLLSIFALSEGYTITPILITINVVVFIIMVLCGVSIIEPETESMLKWGANYPPFTFDGQQWRLLSSCFLHFGILHLLLNIYALLYIGLNLEPYLGKTRFLTSYILTGIVSSMASGWWHEFDVSAGASGAIFGMYGFFMAMLTTNYIGKATRRALFRSIAIFVFSNFIFGFGDEQVDNAAHVGGLLSGLIFGYAFLPSLKKFNNTSILYSTVALITAFVFTALYFLNGSQNNDSNYYDTKMEEFYSRDELSLNYLNLPDNTPVEKLVEEIEEKSIVYAEKNLVLLNSFSELNLPKDIKLRNERLTQYSKLRLQSFKLLLKALNEETDQYDKKIDSLYNEIDLMLNQLEVKQVNNN